LAHSVQENHRTNPRPRTCLLDYVSKGARINHGTRILLLDLLLDALQGHRATRGSRATIVRTVSTTTTSTTSSTSTGSARLVVLMMRALATLRLLDATRTSTSLKSRQPKTPLEPARIGRTVRAFGASLTILTARLNKDRVKVARTTNDLRDDVNWLHVDITQNSYVARGECGDRTLRILQDVRTEITVEKGRTNIDDNGGQEGTIHEVTGRKGHNSRGQSRTRDGGQSAKERRERRLGRACLWSRDRCHNGGRRHRRSVLRERRRARAAARRTTIRTTIRHRAKKFDDEGKF